MNTSDTEWEKEKFNELLTLVKRGHEAVINEEEIEEYYGELRTFITSLRTSRDTYWKERVRKLIDENQGDYESKNPEINWIKAVPVEVLDQLLTKE